MPSRSDRPYLLFPRPFVTPLEKRRGGGGGLSPQLPSFQRQQQRVDRLIDDLKSGFESRHAEFRTKVSGIAPEDVVVFETIGDATNFQAAVRRIDGLEWLAEFAPSKVDPDDDFHYAADPEKQVDQVLYLTMTDHQSLSRIVALWEDYKRHEGETVERNYSGFRHLFAQVRDIRFWGREDRLKGTSVRENLRFEIEQGAANVTVESELWFRSDESERVLRSQVFKDRLIESGGRPLSEAVIEPIAYHAVLCELPKAVALAFLENDAEISFLNDSSVQYFRPTAQVSVPVPREPATRIAIAVDQLPQVSSLDAQVALLDGLPLENHQWLRGGIVVDDPEGWAETYPANDRWHGTAMASLLIRGDFQAGEEPSNHPIYVRPVMRPATSGPNGHTEERIPSDCLPLDLVRRAFRRMFEGEGGEPPTAPGVKVVNFSIGDEAMQFDREISPWARLFDWLSCQYNVLIIVSVGNYRGEIELSVTNDETDTLPLQEGTDDLIRSVARQIQQRRLLAPAEAVNVLSVGALHEDASKVDSIPQDRWDDSLMIGQPSPINRLGHGYGRNLKPDVLIPGGRQLYRKKLGSPSQNAVLKIDDVTTQPPGQLVAAPGINPGQTDCGAYVCGTSNATAIGSRRASQIIDVVRLLDGGAGGEPVPDEWLPVMAKALLTHGASWQDSESPFRRIILENVNSQGVKPYTSRFLGFGGIDITAPLDCSEHSVTVLGYGGFDSEGAHIFALPIPEVFQRTKVWKRITLTLAWISPINPRHRAYRRAVLSLVPTMETFKVKLGVAGVDVDASSTKRGTVQHLRLEGSDKSHLASIENLELEVRCSERAGGINHDFVRYAVAATIEVDQSIDVRLYEEIAMRIRQSVPVQV